MKVVRDDLGPYVEQPLEVHDRFRKRPEGCKILQVPNMMGEERRASLGHTDGIFQLGTAGQHRLPKLPGHEDGLWSVPARAAQWHRGPTKGPHDAIVRADVDGTVVGEKR